MAQYIVFLPEGRSERIQADDLAEAAQCMSEHDGIGVMQVD
jgi:hypothetical protein